METIKNLVLIGKTHNNHIIKLSFPVASVDCTELVSNKQIQKLEREYPNYVNLFDVKLLGKS